MKKLPFGRGRPEGEPPTLRAQRALNPDYGASVVLPVAP